MSLGPQLLLIAAVAAVGVLHTIVPDHWLPIALIARQRGWSRAETARASLQAGVGHAVSTLLIAAVVWLGGVAVAERFGHVVDTASSVALIAFGLWIAMSAWRDLHAPSGHGHRHRHAVSHVHDDLAHGEAASIHGPELQRLDTPDGTLELSIFESGGAPRFRLSGVHADHVVTQVHWDDGRRQDFVFKHRGRYWESVDAIPEPHQFAVAVTLSHDNHAHRYQSRFVEGADTHGGQAHDHALVHDHGQSWLTPEQDPLYVPLRGETAVLTRHTHAHRHRGGSVHAHWHDHLPASSHEVTAATEAAPPEHAHRHKTTARTALLLILGSSPMLEGIPAFFAAGKYGVGLIIIMAVVFALSTIATYVLLGVYSTAGLQRARFGAFERYGEVLSGAFIASVGVAFWIWPVL